MIGNWLERKKKILTHTHTNIHFHAHEQPSIFFGAEIVFFWRTPSAGLPPPLFSGAFTNLLTTTRSATIAGDSIIDCCLRQLLIGSIQPQSL